LSLLDWARLCRVRSLLSDAPWVLADPEGLVLTYAWSLHAWRHRLTRHDPLTWAIAVIDLERTRDLSFMSHQAEDGWELGEYVVTLRGAMQLLARFGPGRPWWADKWPCEECLCKLCGAPLPWYPSSTCMDHDACFARARQWRAENPAHTDEEEEL